MALNWKEIDRLVKAEKRTEATASELDLLRQLRLWWCLKYSRPFKDPLLLSYTLNELIYEYLTHYYLDPENDPKNEKEKKEQELSDIEWAKKALAEENAKQAAKTPKTDQVKPPEEPTESNVENPESLPELSTKFDE